MKRIGFNRQSKKARNRNTRQAARVRRQLGVAQGKILKRMGVKVGRKAIKVSQIPNLVNYRNVMAGMGRTVSRVDIRKNKNSY